jgi:DNA-binding HxlR family transcriptional regulator
MKTDESSPRHIEQQFSRNERRATALKRTAGLLGRKWHIAILYHLSRADGMRFNQLQTEIDGISGKVLSESLERLDNRYGVVEREILSDKPLRVEYSLSETGETMEPMLSVIVEWARTNQTLLEASSA